MNSPKTQMPDAEICSGFSVLRSFKMMMLQPAHPAYAYLIRSSCWRQKQIEMQNLLRRHSDEKTTEQK